MAWLSDWANRRKITVDNTNIDSDLTHFPVPIVLGTSVGQSSQDVSDIFDVLDQQDVDDDFTGTNGDLPNTDLWNLLFESTTGVSEIQSNKYYCTLDTVAAEDYSTLIGNYILTGDFDVQIGISSFSSTTAGAGLSLRFIIGTDHTTTGSDDLAFLKIQPNTSSNGWFSRIKNSTVNSDSSVNRTNAYGSFRITRSGSTLSLYYDDGDSGSWTLIDSDTGFSTDDGLIMLEGWSPAAANPVSGYFDNFTVSSGTIVWPDNTNPNRKKIAITQSDGETEMFGEIELWDQVNESAVIWVSSRDLTLTSAANTDLYLYYDSNQSANVDYIGEAGGDFVSSITGDDFTGDDGDKPDIIKWSINQRLWDIYPVTQDADITIQSNELNIPANAGGSRGNATSNFYITGDFDVEVVCDASASNSTDWLGAFYMWFDEANRAYIDMQVSPSNQFEFNSSVADVWVGATTAARTNTICAFKMVRVGSNLTTSYKDGLGDSWHALATKNCTTEDIWIVLYARHAGATTGTTTFNDFVINSGIVMELPNSNVWDLEFRGTYHMANDPNGDISDSMKDSSRYRFHGTPDGTMLTEDLVAGEIGKAIEFDGTDDLITVPNDFDSTSDFTAEVKVYFENKTLDNSFLGVGFSYSNDTGKMMQLDSSSLGYRIYSGNQNTSSNIEETVQRWAHMVMTCSSNVVNLYKDLTQIITNYTETPAGWETDTLIGTESVGGAKSLVGKISEVRLSRSVRSSAWIKAGYYSLKDDLITFGTAEILGVTATTGSVTIAGVAATIRSIFGSPDDRINTVPALDRINTVPALDRINTVPLIK